MKNITWPSRNVGITAGLIAGGAGLALITGFGVAPSLLASASSPATDGIAVVQSSSTTAADGASTTAPGDRVVQAGAAGSLAVAERDGTLELVSTSPAAGWTVEVEQVAGREVEVDFRRGSERVQVDVEIEDGVVRDRVRLRDDATGGRDDGSGGHSTDDAPGDNDGSGGHSTD